MSETGMSSLASLKEFPVAFVQIARSFVSEFLTDPFSKGLVRYSKEIAHWRGTRTSAVGDASTEFIDMFRLMGVDYLEFSGTPRGQRAHWTTRPRLALDASAYIPLSRTKISWRVSAIMRAHRAAAECCPPRPNANRAYLR
jgi:hypothetical protein